MAESPIPPSIRGRKWWRKAPPLPTPPSPAPDKPSLVVDNEGEAAEATCGVQEIEQEMRRAKLLLDSHAHSLSSLRQRIIALKSSLEEAHMCEAAALKAERSTACSPQISGNPVSLSMSRGSSPVRVKGPEERFSRPTLGKMIYGSLPTVISNRGGNECYKKLFIALRCRPRVLGPALSHFPGDAMFGLAASSIIGEICGYCPVPNHPCPEGEAAALALISEMRAPLPVLSLSCDDEFQDSIEVAIIREFCRRCAGSYLETTIGPLVQILARKSSVDPPPPRHLLSILSRLLQNLLRSLSGIPPGVLQLAEVVQLSRGSEEKKLKQWNSPPIIAVHSAKLRRKPKLIEDPYETARKRTLSAAGGLDPPWGFVFGELVPFALRHASSLGLSGHLPLSSRNLNDLDKLACLIEDLSAKESPGTPRGCDNLAPFLPPMRLSIRHYLKNFHYPSLSKNLSVYPQGDPSETPLLIDCRVACRVHRCIFTHYRQQDSLSLKYSELPVGLVKALELCGDPDEPAVLCRGRSKTLPPRYASSFDLERASSPQSSSSESASCYTTARPPIVALLPSLQPLRVPQVRLARVLRKGSMDSKGEGGVPNRVTPEIAHSAERLVRVICGMLGFRGRNMKEITLKLEADGNLGESLALRGALFDLRKSLGSQRDSSYTKEDVPPWLLKRILEIYGKWRSGIEAAVRTAAHTYVKLESFMNISRARRMLATRRIALIQARRDVEVANRGLLGFLKALQEIPESECTPRTIMEEVVGEEGVKHSALAAEMGRDRGDFECRECRSKYDRMHSVLEEHIHENTTAGLAGSTSTGSPPESNFEDSYPNSNPLRGVTLSGVFLGRTPTSPDDEVKVDVKRQQAEATLHVRDVYVAKGKDYMLLGCACCNEKFSTTLSRLHATHQTSLQSLQSILCAPVSSNPPPLPVTLCLLQGAKIGDEQGVGLREGEGGVLRGLQLEITRLCESDSILVKMEAIKNFDRILSATLHTGLLESRGSYYTALVGVSVLGASPSNLLSHLVALEHFYPNHDQVPGFVRFASAIRQLLLVKVQKCPPDPTKSPSKAIPRTNFKMTGTLPEERDPTARSASEPGMERSEGKTRNTTNRKRCSWTPSPRRLNPVTEIPKPRITISGKARMEIAQIESVKKDMRLDAKVSKLHIHKILSNSKLSKSTDWIDRRELRRAPDEKEKGDQHKKPISKGQAKVSESCRYQEKKNSGCTDGFAPRRKTRRTVEYQEIG